MYFLRRRHGRKPQPDARRDAAPMGPNSGPSAGPNSGVEAGLQSAIDSGALQEPQLAYPDAPPEPPRPLVIKKTKRQRAATPPPEDDCKPAGTFRSGTLHIAHGSGSEPQHGKL